MLYKKYHRNFVRQFRYGTKIKVHLDNSDITTVLRDPHVDLYHPSWILIEDDFMIRKLIRMNGKLREDIEIIGE